MFDKLMGLFNMAAKTNPSKEDFESFIRNVGRVISDSIGKDLPSFVYDRLLEMPNELLGRLTVNQALYICKLVADGGLDSYYDSETKALWAEVQAGIERYAKEHLETL